MERRWIWGGFWQGIFVPCGQNSMATPTSPWDETITMIIINDRREVSAPLDRVWDIVADVDNNPVHWPNLRTVDNISKDGIVIEREEKLR